MEPGPSKNRYSLLQLSSPGPQTRLTRRSKRRLLFFLVLLFYAAIFAFGGYVAWKSYTLKWHGVEKKVRVLELEQTTRAPKTGSTYYYRLEMDGRQFTHWFSVRLPVGHQISMLTLAGSPGEMVPASRKDSLFTILAAFTGGRVMAVVLIVGIFTSILVIPKLFKDVQRSWR